MGDAHPCRKEVRHDWSKEIRSGGLSSRRSISAIGQLSYSPVASLLEGIPWLANLTVFYNWSTTIVLFCSALTKFRFQRLCPWHLLHYCRVSSFRFSISIYYGVFYSKMTYVSCECDLWNSSNSAWHDTSDSFGELLFFLQILRRMCKNKA